jgi:dephospho-CoA kinase
VITVGLTGGIGSGKTTVSGMLEEHGAVVVDADVLAREAVEPGRPAWERLRERFGEEVLRPDGAVDRAALASVVFSDDTARTDLEAIVHPEVARLMADRLAAESAGDRVVVLDIPLLAESGRDRYPLAGVLVVDCPVDIAVERLVSGRGMDREDAERRVAAQASRSERIRAADFVIMNMGTIDELRQMVELAWRWIEGLAAAAPGAPEGR